MNEPLANLTHDMDDESMNHTAQEHDLYVKRCIHDWRSIQLQVVKSIWTDLEWTKGHRIIVTNGKYLAKELGIRYTFQDYNLTQFTEWRFAAYKNSELVVPNIPYPAYNLIYSVHQYSPFNYTHRYYIGNALPPPYVKLFGNPDPAVSDYPEDTTGVARYNRDNVLNGINPAQQWRIDNGMPPMFVGEFGVKVISEADLWDPNGNPSADPDELKYRGQWIYDNRVDLENYGIGWCYFDYCSQFGCFTGRFTNYLGQRQNRGVVESNAEAGLFGDVRSQ